MRSMVLSCLLAAAAAPTPQAAEAAINRVDLNIARQPLDAALSSFSEQTHIQVARMSDQGHPVGDVGPLSGAYEPKAALDVLLKGTGLSFQFINDRMVRIYDLTTVSATGPGETATTSTNSSDPSASKEGKSQSSGEFRLAQTTEGASAQPPSVENPNDQRVSQNKPVELQEIVVTAQKREEKLEDVPVPVTVLGAPSLLESNQVRLQDYYANVPGLSVSPSPSAAGEQTLSIRGITTGSNTNPTVGITVDDVPFGSSTNLVGDVVPDIDPNDLVRVEVLRGPQGTLYGASSMGGLIKYVTVDPSTEALSGHVEAGTSAVYNGAQVGYHFRGSINVPVTDAVAVRASGFTREDPGYIDNPSYRIDGVNKDRVSGGRLAALWQPSNNFTLKLSALYQDARADGSGDVDRPRAGHELPPLGDLQQSYFPGMGAYERKVQAYSATLKARAGGVELASISGYNINTFSSSVDATYLLGPVAQGYFGLPGAGDFAQGKNSKFTQELRLSVPIGTSVDWLLGGFYTHENTPYSEDIWALTSAGAQGVDLLNVPAPRTYTEYAGFTDLTFHLTDQFDIQLGGRESEIRQTSQEAVQTGPLAGGVTPRADSNANAFTYLLTPRFKVSVDLMIYARFASGYRPGGVNFNPDPAVPRQFSPDKTQNYELGIKGNALDHVLSYDASLYRIEWRNLQLTLVDPTNIQTFTANAARARSQGLELSSTARPAAGLTIAAWVAWNDAKLTEPIPPDNTVVGFAGDRLPFSSRYSGNLALDQQFPLWNDITGFVGGTLIYVGDRWGSFVSPPAPRQQYPAYARADLRAGAKLESWTVNLFATNVADKRGVLGGGAGNFPPFAFNYIQPRTVGLSLSRAF